MSMADGTIFNIVNYYVVYNIVLIVAARSEAIRALYTIRLALVRGPRPRFNVCCVVHGLALTISAWSTAAL